MKIPISLYLILFCFSPIFSYAILINKDSVEVESYYQLVDNSFYDGFEQLLPLIDSLSSKAKSMNWWERYIDAIQWKQSAAHYYGKIDLLKESVEKGKNELKKYRIELGDSFAILDVYQLLNEGRYNYEIGLSNKALANFQTVVSKGDSINFKKVDDLRTITVALNFIGAIYKTEKGQYRRSLDYYKENQKWEIRIRDMFGPNYSYDGYIHKHLGDVYLFLNDYKKAETEYLLAKEIISRKKEATPSSQRFNNRFIYTLRALSNLYLKQGNFEQADRFVNDAIEEALPNNSLLNELYEKKGEIHAQANNSSLALSNFKKSLNLTHRDYGAKTSRCAPIYRNIGNLFAQNQRYDSALWYYQVSLLQVLPNFNDTVYNIIAPVDFVTSKNEAVLSFAAKAETLKKIYASSPENNENLSLAWQNTLLALKLLKNLKNDMGIAYYESSEEKRFLVEESYPIYELAMSLAFQLFQQTGDKQYYEEAFRISEESKGVLLWESVAKSHANSYSGLPDSLIEQEQTLRYQLNLLMEEKREKGESNNLEALQTLNDSLIQLKDRLETHILSIQDQYPQYAEIIQQPTLDHSIVSKNLLTRGQLLIEYFWGDIHIYAMASTSDSVYFERIESPEGIRDTIEALQHAIHSFPTSDPEALSSSSEFEPHALFLYNKLLKPILKRSPTSSKLIIIPDGILNYLPFEALLTQAPSEAYAYYSYPYLIKNYEISYCYSASLLQRMATFEKPITQKGLLAVGVTFENWGQAPIEMIDARGKIRAIPFTKDEVENIHQIFPGRMLINEEATEDQVLNLLPQFNLLHFATHFFAQDSAEHNAYLALAHANDSNDIDRLYIRELYNLNLHSDMVVLSACETGVGRLKKGEGIISLARAFSFAQAKSVVATRWVVNDKPAAELFKLFYQNLNMGKSKEVALAQAKRGFIMSQSITENCHPFYWAAPMLIGDISSVRLSFSQKYWKLGLLLILAILFLVLFNKGKLN